MAILDPKDTGYKLATNSQTTYTVNSSISGNGTSITGLGIPWANTTTITDTSISINPNWHNGASTKIQLHGPNADIEINGESLVDMIRAIEQRLNILKPNEELESEWEELRALGEQYRKLEEHIEAKMKTWEVISK